MNQQMQESGSGAGQNSGFQNYFKPNGGRQKQGYGMGPARQLNNQNEEVSDEEECGDTDEHIVHAAANFNPSGMMSASDSGATISQQMLYS